LYVPLPVAVGQSLYVAEMEADFTVKVAAGSLRSRVRADSTLPHRWTDEGVAIELQFTGAHLLHLAAAGCVLNDLYREAAQAGVEINGAVVTASGDFDTSTWRSTGITYRVEVDSSAPAEDVDRLLRVVDDVAEIPKALRSGTTVDREE
jgi:uncharacterized OsmC-like protein